MLFAHIRKCIVFILPLVLWGTAGRAHHVIDSLNNGALQHFKNGEYGDALSSYLEALKTAQKEKRCADEAYATFQVGRTLYYLKDHRQALNYLFTASKVAANCPGDSAGQKLFQLIGSIYQELEKPDSSIYFYNEAREKLEGTQNNEELSNLYGVMGELYARQLHNDSAAKRCVGLCEQYALLSGNKSSIAFAYSKKSIYLAEHGDCKQAGLLGQKAYDLYREVKETDGMIYSLNVILFSKTQCADKSIYDVLAVMQNMRDSIFQAKTAEKVAQYKGLYETEKTEAENKKLQEATARKNILIGAIMIVSTTLLLLIWLAYNRYRIKKESEFEKEKNLHRSLQYKALIEGEEKERTRIARELHDSIGQILSAAKMNVSVIKPSGNDDEEVRVNAMGLIDRAVTEVRTISHNLMPSALSELGLKPALKALVKAVNTASALQIKLEMDDEPVMLKSAEVVVYRIIQEIIHNTIKHAKATELVIKFGSSGRNITLDTRDNGTGFDTGQIATSGGIGWKNIFLRTELLNGKIAVDSEQNKGTSIHIEFAG